MIFFLLVLFTANYVHATLENIEDPCQRCTCSDLDNAQITVLKCTNQNLNGMLSKWPSTNATTIKAFFTGNNISTLETIPPTDATVEITLTGCNIQNLYNDLFAAAKNTKLVDLSFNRLTYETLSANVFAGPYKDEKMIPLALEDLNLAYNQIHSLNKDIFRFLPNLKRLNLEGNAFRVLDYHTQLALSSVQLVDLNLANNGLVDLVEGAIERYKNLVTINVARNRLDFVPTSLDSVGESLEILIVDDNPIIELDADSFAGLNNLVEISANNLTKLKQVSPNTFSSMINLKKISLSNNLLLETIDEKAFGKNQPVQEVHLANNNLKQISYNLLVWSKLKILEIQENPLECTCDLYNITTELSTDITRNEDGPHCLDPQTERRIPVYSLKSEICGAKPKRRGRYPRVYRHFSVSLAGLVVTLVVAIFVAMVLFYSRYRKFLRNRNYPYATQVLYNPITRS